MPSWNGPKQIKSSGMIVLKMVVETVFQTKNAKLCNFCRVVPGSRSKRLLLVLLASFRLQRWRRLAWQSRLPRLELPLVYSRSWAL